MDYAAALRATPAGPAVRIDTTPAAKVQPQKVVVSKPAKVEADEPAHVVEDETLPSISAPSAPAKPPTNAGLSPVVRFMINVPHSSSTAKDASAPSAETITETSDSASDTEEDGSGEAGANGSKSNKNEPKAHYFSAHDLEINKARLMDLVALLEKNAEESAFELSGGFRFSKSMKGSGKAAGIHYHDLEFPTVTLSLKWLSALIELLRGKQSTTIALGGGSFVSMARVEGQIRVIRISPASVAGKEVWLQFDDVVLEVREQAKLYLSVANRIEQVLERKEAQMGEASRKDAAKKRKAISNKLQTPAFTSMLATLHSSLANSTEFPTLAKRFHDQEAQLAQERLRVKEENQDMMNMFLAMVPSHLLEANLKHISAKFEPADPEVAGGDEATSSASPVEAKEEKPKKLSKKEQAIADKAAAAAELERKKLVEAEAEASRKEADKVRREKAEKLAAIAAEQKKKQLVANPFAHLESFSESAAAQLEAQADAAKEKKIKADAEAKVKADAKAALDAKALAAQEAAAKAAKAAKPSAPAQDSLKRQTADDSKRAANKDAEEKRRAAAKEAEAKKRDAADRQAAEQAAAAKRKQDKADKVAAEKAAAAERKKTSSPSPSIVSPQEDKKKGVAGPDRSEKQRKAEKIEQQQKEKQRAKEIRQLVKKTDNSTLYLAIGGGAVVVLLLAFFIYNQMVSGAVSI